MVIKNSFRWLLLTSALSLAVPGGASEYVPDSDGVISLEAESAVLAGGVDGEMFVETFPSGASASGMAAPEVNWYTGADDAEANAPSLEWPILVENPGAYRVWVRGYSYDGGSDSIWMQINSGNASSVHNFSANNWVWSSSVSTDLGAGAQTLKLLQREKRLIVDKVVLQPAGLAAPTGLGPDESGTSVTETEGPFVAVDGVVTVEAESAGTSAGSVGDEWYLSTSPAGAAGSLAMKAPADVWYTSRAAAANAPTLSIPIRLEETGDYYLWIRGYAFDGGSDSVWWSFNDDILRARHRFLFNTWTWRRVASQRLEAGDHTVHLVQREKNFVIDKIAVALVGTPNLSGTGPAESARAGDDNPNIAPVADAGGDQVAVVGDTVTLNGAGSTDSDGTIEEYTWFNGAVQIGTGQQIQYAVSAEGSQTISLTVTDDDGATDTDTLIIEATLPNVPPVADAGGDLVAVVGDTVTLNGAGSADSDGTIEEYTWFNGAVEIGAGQQIQYTVSTEGSQTISLTVTDDDGATDTDSMVIEGTVAGDGPYVAINGIVTVEAENANAEAGRDGDEWFTTASPTGASGALAMKAPTFAWYTGSAVNAPRLNMPVRLEQAGTYELWVRGYAFNGGSDSVHWGFNGSPSAQVHSFQYNTWSWRRAGSAYLAAGDHTVDLAQREKNFVIDKVVVQLAGNSTPSGFGPAESRRAGDPSPNIAPVANAGSNIAAVFGETVTLNGAGSYDSDGNIVSYVWRNGSVNIGTGQQVQYTINTESTHAISLTVTDNDGAFDTDSLVINVTDGTDSDGDGVPDLIDNCPFDPGPASNGGCPIEVVSCLPDFQAPGFNKSLWPQTDFGLPTTVGQSKLWANPNGGDYSVRVTKVSDQSFAASIGGGSYLHTRPEYAQHDAFSADGTYLISHGTVDRALYNALTHEAIRMVGIGSDTVLRDWQWHPTIDHLAFYFDTRSDKVYRYNVVQDTHTVLFDFAANPVSVEGQLFSDLGSSDDKNSMGGQGSITAAGDSVAVILTGNGNGAVVQLNLDTATVGASLFLAGKDDSSELDIASVTPDGRYVIVLGEFNSLYGTSFDKKQLYAYDVEGDFSVSGGKLVLGRQGHFDVGLDKNGNPVMAYFLYMPMNGWDGYTGSVPGSEVGVIGHYDFGSGTYTQHLTSQTGVWGSGMPTGHISMSLDGSGVALISASQGDHADSNTSVQDSALIALDLESGNIAWMGWDDSNNPTASGTFYADGTSMYWGGVHASLMNDVVTDNGARGWKWAWASDNGDPTTFPDYYVGELVCN